MSDNATTGVEQIVSRLKTDDVALELTHGEGQAYYAWVDGELHHFRDHHRAESAEPGDDAMERLGIDADYLPLFDPSFVSLADSPFSRSSDTGAAHTGGDADE